MQCKCSQYGAACSKAGVKDKKYGIYALNDPEFPFQEAMGRTWGHLRTYCGDGSHPPVAVMDMFDREYGRSMKAARMVA